MSDVISIAIETSCRRGSLALGVGDELRHVLDFDASSRHATQLVSRLSELVGHCGYRPAEVGEVYVSAGPGSFTGVRVGITVARTLAQAVPNLRCVSVPSAWAVAFNVHDLRWQHLAVIMDAKDELVYLQRFDRQPAPTAGGVPFGQSGHGWIASAGEPSVGTVQDLLSTAPRPLLLVGEGLAYHQAFGPDVSQADASANYPTARGVWHVGRALARAGAFVDYHRLLPIYARKSEAERLWDLKNP